MSGETYLGCRESFKVLVIAYACVYARTRTIIFGLGIQGEERLARREGQTWYALCSYDRVCGGAFGFIRTGISKQIDKTIEQ